MVNQQQQTIALVGWGRSTRLPQVGVVEQAVGKPLLLQRIAAVERAGATHCVAQAVAKRADAQAAHVQLGGVDTSGVIRHFAKVPPFAIEVDLRTIHPVGFHG